MADKDSSDLFLDALFDEARSLEDETPPALLARVLEDGYDVQDAAVIPAVPAPRRSFWAAVGETLGGWPGIAGLAAAGVAGVWIGVAPPEMVSTEVASLFGVDTDLSDLVLDDGFEFFDTLMAEDI